MLKPMKNWYEKSILFSNYRYKSKSNSEHQKFINLDVNLFCCQVKTQYYQSDKMMEVTHTEILK